MKIHLLYPCFLFGISSLASDHSAPPGPSNSIDPLWQEASFRRAFTASYGIDARIEPLVNAGEKEVLNQVAELMKKEDREGAIAKLVGDSNLNESAALIFTLGNLRFESGAVEDALVNFERAIALHPNFRDAHRNLAVALVQQSQFDAAEPHLVRALELGARDGLTLGLLGYCHANADRSQAALQAYRLAQLTMPEELQWKLGEAHALLALNDARGSVSIYSQLLEQRADDGALWSNQADAYLQLGESVPAIANLEFARRLNQLNPAETISLGHLYLNEGLVDSAMECYQATLSGEAEAPFDKLVDALENLTRFRRWHEAGILVEALSENPRFRGRSDNDKGITSRLMRCRGLIELEAGDPTIGFGLVQSLVESDPLDGAALILLAKFQAREKRFEEAELLLQQAASLDAFAVAAWRELGKLLVQAGRYGDAVNPLRQALEREPDANLSQYLDAVERAAKQEG
ncbi:MAG: tetratricopeptide repeat protein [Verrucomicrobiae bacterium]|nr:tetratricopeptide repeat protein [Verrucomicrobiae bacterium]